MTGEDLIFELFTRCRRAALGTGVVPGEAVHLLIQQTREILTHYGCSRRDCDTVFFNVYTVVHWDWKEPTARVFETLLEIELADFFAEWKLN